MSSDPIERRLEALEREVAQLRRWRNAALILAMAIVLGVPLLYRTYRQAADASGRWNVVRQETERLRLEVDAMRRPLRRK